MASSYNESAKDVLETNNLDEENKELFGVEVLDIHGKSTSSTKIRNNVSKIFLQGSMKVSTTRIPYRIRRPSTFRFSEYQKHTNI